MVQEARSLVFHKQSVPREEVVEAVGVVGCDVVYILRHRKMSAANESVVPQKSADSLQSDVVGPQSLNPSDHDTCRLRLEGFPKCH